MLLLVLELLAKAHRERDVVPLYTTVAFDESPVIFVSLACDTETRRPALSDLCIRLARQNETIAKIAVEVTFKIAYESAF